MESMIAIFEHIGGIPTEIWFDNTSTMFFASTFWQKLQNIFGECCISKLEKVAKPRLAAVLPAA